VSELDQTSTMNVWIALVHYPVLNRQRDVVTTAITNLDVHDIARAARTYNLRRYFIVTPIERQRALASKIVAHWVEGYGASRVPERGEALRLVETADSLERAIERVAEDSGKRPIVVATCARAGKATISYHSLSEKIVSGDPVLVLLGTGWGLAEPVFEISDEVLQPIDVPGGDYNHLSVRTAAAITLDRLIGRAC
jgi:hypothetical protein